MKLRDVLLCFICLLGLLIGGTGLYKYQKNRSIHRLKAKRAAAKAERAAGAKRDRRFPKVLGVCPAITDMGSSDWLDVEVQFPAAPC